MSFLCSRLSISARASTRVVSGAVAKPIAMRPLATSALRLSAQPPVIQGEGAPSGTMPTDEEQSTGLERFELMGRFEGVDVFDQQPLDASRLGTKKDPIQVKSMVRTDNAAHRQYHQQIIGCTGFPAESHETLWLDMNTEKEFTRCPRCGSGTCVWLTPVYALEFLGEHGHAH